MPGAPLTASNLLSWVRAVLRKTPTADTLAKAVEFMGSIPPQWREAGPLRASVTRYLAPLGIAGRETGERILESVVRLLPLDPVGRGECEALMKATVDDVSGLVDSIPLLGSLGRKMVQLMAVNYSLYLHNRGQQKRVRRKSIQCVAIQRLRMVLWKGRVVRALRHRHTLHEEYVGQGAVLLTNSAHAVRHMAMRRVNEKATAVLADKHQHKLHLYESAERDLTQKERTPPPPSAAERPEKRRRTQDGGQVLRSWSSPPQAVRAVVRTPPRPPGYSTP